MQKSKIGAHKTTVTIIESKEDDLKQGVIVTYHDTKVVQFNSNSIILNSAGQLTLTTKKRMNEASKQFNLNFYVYQKNKKWYIDYKNRIILYFDGIELKR